MSVCQLPVPSAVVVASRVPPVFGWYNLTVEFASAVPLMVRPDVAVVILSLFSKPLSSASARSRLAGALGATLGNQLFIYLMIYLLLLGINHQLSFWLVAGMYTLTYFVTLVPISINGIGVQELSMTFLLVQLGGLSSSESATIALLTRVLFILTSLPGAFFLPSILAAMNEKKVVE